MFVFVHPLEAEALKKKGKMLRDITYELAQSEIVKHSGLNISEGTYTHCSFPSCPCCLSLNCPDLSCFLLLEDTLLQEEVMSVMQLVQDVNAMAEDMEKPVEYSIELLSPEARGLSLRNSLHCAAKEFS